MNDEDFGELSGGLGEAVEQGRRRDVLPKRRPRQLGSGGIMTNI